MVSLISLIINLFDRRKIVEVRRMPPRRVLRAHLLGLTFGLVFVLFTLGLNISNLNVFHVLLHLIIFAIGTYVGGPFLILAAILAILTNGKLGPSFSSSFFYLTDWYLLGYLFGGIFATLYNDLVFLYLISFGSRRVKIAFAYDRTSEFNIIKSPIEAEEKNLLKALQNIPFFVLNIRQNSEVEKSARKIIRLIRRARRRMSRIDRQSLGEILERITSETGFSAQLANLRRRLNRREEPVLDAIRNDVEPLIDKYLRLTDKRLYDYELKTPTERPYTIAFVANPKILTRREPEIAYDEHRADPNSYETDPIIKDRDLFMQSVDRALFTLERDEVVGQPDIWSRIRVITIFDENLATADGPRYGLVEQFQDDLIIENRVIENLVDPSEQMIENARHMFKTYDVPEQIREDVDVIYALTAARNHDRSMAHYSDYLESKDDDPHSDTDKEKEFSYNPDPNHTKNTEINVHMCPDSPRFICRHELKAAIPGRVALNVVGARKKTFIHEFGHAMSSAYRGAIVDEYTDRLVVRKRGNGEPEPTPEDTKEGFYVNRIARSENGELIPVHKVFAKYEDEVYRSDLDHPSSEEEWRGYFPDRGDQAVGCTMDRTIGRYRFDNLISAFMYDRLLTKLNRKEP